MAGLTHLDAAQGASEQRAEAYMKYGEGAAELATQRCAKSAGRVHGSARQQASTVREFHTSGHESIF